MSLTPYRAFVRLHAPRNERTPATFAVPLKLTRNREDTAYLPDMSGASGDARARGLTPVSRRRTR